MNCYGVKKAVPELLELAQKFELGTNDLFYPDAFQAVLHQEAEYSVCEPEKPLTRKGKRNSSIKHKLQSFW